MTADEQGFPRKVLDALGHSVIVTSPEGIILKWNSAAEKLYGWDAEEVLGRSIFDVTPADISRGEAVRIMERLIAGESWSGEFPVRHKDGGEFIAHVTSNPIIGEDGRLETIVGVSFDARHLIEQRREQENRQKRNIAILNSVKAGILVQDRTGKLTWTNETAAELFGLTREEILTSSSENRDWGMTDESGAAVPPEEHPSILTLNTGEPQRNAVRGLFRNDPDKAKWLLVNTEPVFLYDDEKPQEVIITFTDITELIESRQRLNDIVTAVNIGLWSWDMASGSVDYSDQWKRQIGYEPEEIGNGFDEWESRVHPDDLPGALSIVNGSIEAKAAVWSLEFRFRHKDGHYLWILADAATVLDPDGDPVGARGSHIDITRLKEAEEKLSKAKEALEKAQTTASIGSWEYFFDTGRTVFSRQVFDMMGITPEPKQEETFKQLGMVYAEDLPLASALRSGALEEGLPFSEEFRLVRADGSVIWVHAIGEPVYDFNGSRVRFDGTIQDITKRKQAEEALRETSAVLQAALDCSPAGVLIADPEGKLKYVNESALTIIGETAESLFDSFCVRSWVENGSVAREDGTPFKTDEEPLARALFKGETSSERVRISLRDGSGTRWVWSHAAPIRDESGKTVAAILVFPDITELKRAEQENADLEEKLAHSLKMESVGRLAGGIAHDFNNLLTVILGNTAMAKMQRPVGEDLTRVLGDIETSASRAAELTGQLLAFSRKQIIEPVVLMPAALLERSAAMLRRLIGEDIELVLDLDSPAGPVKVDPVQLEQVMINLVVNAREAMPQGGRLSITLDRASLSKKFCKAHPGMSPGYHVSIKVEDDGQGIDPEDMERIFDPFYTTKADGTGMGLSTVYGILRQHAGCIEVRSSPDKGTVFTIYLPETEEPLSEENAHPERARLQTGTETVMVVEDDTMVRSVAVRMLSMLGYRVLEADCAEIALKIMEGEGIRADLLFTDVVMPGMNGKELADRLLEIDPDLKVLFASGYTEKTIEHHGVLDSGLHFLHKPYTSEVLSAKIREVLDS